MNEGQDQHGKSKIDLASVVSRKVQIDSVRLISTTASQSPRVLSEPPSDVELQSRTSVSADLDRLVILILAQFRFVASCSEETVSEPDLTIEASFELSYSLASFDDIDDSHIQAFGELNGIYNGWPYWREFVQSTLSRMGLPPLTLPVYRPQKSDYERPRLGSPERKAPKRKGVKKKPSS
jgi:hypothetical protein